MKRGCPFETASLTNSYLIKRAFEEARPLPIRSSAEGWFALLNLTDAVITSVSHIDIA